MKIAIFEFLDSNDTNVAHLRIAKFLEKELENATIVNSVETIKKTYNTKFDAIIVMYAARFFNDGSFKWVEKWFDNQKSAKLYWCINEYNLVPNSFLNNLFKQNGVEVISNFEYSGFEKNPACKHTKKYHLINLNITAYRHDAMTLNDRKYEIIYYGTFRPDREKYFRQSITKNFYVSTSVKNIPKFKEVCSPKGFIDKLSWLDGKCFLRNFKYSLYIEDEFTHENFNHLADRFYEAISYDVVPIFHASCRKNIVKSKYPIDESFIFENSIDDFLKSFDMNEAKNKMNALRENYKTERKTEKQKLINIFI